MAACWQFLSSAFTPPFICKSLPSPVAVRLDDLYLFDPANTTWSLLSAAAGSSGPAARWGHGFTSAGGKLYVHGGYGYDNRTGSYGKESVGCVLGAEVCTYGT